MAFQDLTCSRTCELVIAAEGSVPCTDHPSVFTQQLLVFCLIFRTECTGQCGSRVVFLVAIILHNSQPLNLFFQLLGLNERYVAGLSFSPHLEF